MVNKITYLFLIIVLLWCGPVFGANVGALSDDFEGAGAGAWDVWPDPIVGPRVVDYDYSTAGLNVTGWGSECLRIYNNDVSATDVAETYLTAGAEMPISYFKFDFYILAESLANDDYTQFVWNADADETYSIHLIQLNGELRLRINSYHDGVKNTYYSQAVLETETEYTIEIKWDDTNNLWQWRLDRAGQPSDTGVMSSAGEGVTSFYLTNDYGSGAVAVDLLIDNVSTDDSEWHFPNYVNQYTGSAMVAQSTSAFGGATKRRWKVAALSTSLIVAGYSTGLAGDLYIIAGTISSTGVTSWGSAVQVSSDTVRDWAICSISSNRVGIAYSEDDNDGQNVLIGSVDTSTLAITLGAEVNTGAAKALHPAIIECSTDKILVTRSYDNDADNLADDELNVRAATISGTTIGAWGGDFTAVAGAQTFHTRLVKLSDDKVAYLYDDGTNTDLRLHTIRITGTACTNASTFLLKGVTVDTSDPVSLGITGIDDEYVFIAYQKGGVDDLYANICRIDALNDWGGKIYDEKIITTDAGINVFVSKLNDNSYLVGHKEAANVLAWHITVGDGGIETVSNPITIVVSSAYSWPMLARIQDNKAIIVYGDATNGYAQILDLGTDLKFTDNSEDTSFYLDTHASLSAMHTIANDDIIDGQGNVFAEIWTMQSDGADGNQIIYQNAITQGFVDNAKDWMYCRMLIADSSADDGFVLTGENNQWTNCVAYNSTAQGFDVDESTIIKNSIMFGNAGNDMHVADDAGVTITGDHNRFEDAGCTDPGDGTYTDGDGDLTSKTTDPFIAAATDNFRLLSTMILLIDGASLQQILTQVP